jgi:hypothetical protein
MASYESWIHGSSVQVQDHDHVYRIVRKGNYTEVWGKPPTAKGPPNCWYRFAIPTPKVLEGMKVRLPGTTLRFGTGSVVVVRHVHHWDGDKQIARSDNVHLTGKKTWKWLAPSPQPLVNAGLNISVKVETGSHSAFTLKGRMVFISAGARFKTVP